MSKNKKFKGTWIQRVVIIFLGIVLGILLFWLLGFITRDIDSLRGPDRSEVEEEYVDAELVKKQKSLNGTLDEIKENITNKGEQRDILKDSTNSLQNTINQLLSIQKQNIGRSRDLSEQQQQTLVESQAMFLENQKQYQALNKEIAELTAQLRQLNKKMAAVSKEIKGQQALAWAEYNGLWSKHRWKIGALKLAVMIPIFLIVGWVFIKKRSGTYWPIVYAAFIAAFMRISLVAHEYFSKKYFKYIALLVIIAIVLKLLVYLIKRIISPEEGWLIKQYQEAYDKSVCPICSKPVRIGPLRYVVGGKRRGLFLMAWQEGQAAKQELYTCPSCGTELYEKCEKCGDIRHSLLPFCEHCGDEKTDRSL